MRLIKAPETSHVESFGLIPGGSTREGWVVEVTFRAKGKWPRSTYRYLVGSEKKAEGILRMLMNTNHPGVVVHKKLAKAFRPWRVRD